VSELPSRWAEAPMGDLLMDIEAGRSFKCSERPAGPDEWGVIKVSAMTWREFGEGENKAVLRDHKIDPRFEIQSGDLLFSRANTVTYVGAVVQVGETRPRLLLSDKSLRLVPHHSVSPRWLLYYLRTRQARQYLESLATGTSDSMRNISQASLRGLPVPLAPRREQERVVAAIEEQFSRLDAGVAALERAQENLRRVRAAVLQTAVTGQLVAQESGEGSGADLLATIKLEGRRASRRSEGLTTPMPPLPQSWATAPWSAVGYSQNGRAFPSADYTTAGTRLLRPGNLYASGQVGWTAANTRCLPEHYASEFPSYMVGPNEIVMNLTAQSLKDEFLGRVCLTGLRDEPVLLNQRIARLTPVGMNPRFVFYVMKSSLLRRFVDQLNRGSLIQHMFTSQLDQFLLPIPPREEQDRIVERIEEHLASLDHLEYAILRIGKQVPALKSAILAAAFSGRLVSQDPADEPASALLERIASERTSSNGPKSTRTRKPRTLGEKVVV
jgi:type I restriction enzyme S subunit